eukprot:CAMPEP_0185533326 /NCGR_PEP_ID=MMETSP1366-20130426/108384_1 /TAXON_ID=38817 /ORGANISM="Gephyrocapsa oceanica, Strain RCC1303" /LENGTH=134 /DNA_ID=CAMNT_0028145049 /DNA_START=1255 /DNA_END=1656 /DNA_ORIENTATION=-
MGPAEGRGTAAATAAAASARAGAALGSWLEARTAAASHEQGAIGDWGEEGEEEGEGGAPPAVPAGAGLPEAEEGTYEGALARGLRHGWGALWSPDGLAVYLGEWRHGIRWGDGAELRRGTAGGGGLAALYVGGW